MTKSEFKKVNLNWFEGKGFEKVKDYTVEPFHYFRGTTQMYIREFKQFTLYVIVQKDRFDSFYTIDVGYIIPRPKDEFLAGVHVTTLLDGEIYSYFPEKLTQAEYTSYLESIYIKYIQPYFSKGFEHVVYVANDPTCNNTLPLQFAYTDSPRMREILSKIEH